MDRPENIAWPGCTASDGRGRSFEIAELASCLSISPGAENSARYLCLVASGLANDRPLNTFAPNSSRDGHIQLQLKRVLEAVSSPDRDNKNAPPCGPRLGIIFRNALSAGKAARDSSLVPEISTLRFSLRATPAARARAAEAALAKAVEPAVARCLGEIIALDQSEAVSSLRTRAESAARGAVRSMLLETRQDLQYSVDELDSAWISAVRRVLHVPTVALRRGEVVDEESIINSAVGAATDSLIKGVLQGK